MKIEVAYATSVRQVVIALELPEGATAEQAIRESGLLVQFTEIDLARTAIGVFGERVTPEHVLKSGERVEIYRGLLADPKEARRRRARKQR